MGVEHLRCENCNYSKGVKEFHPVSGEVFVSCPRCGYWRQMLEKENNSVSIKDTQAFIEEKDDYYVVGGGGKGAFRIQKEDLLLQVGSLDHNNMDAFTRKADEMIKFDKADEIVYTSKQLGVWFEIDYRTNIKKEIKD